MKKIACFEKVSFEQFKKDVEECFRETKHKFQVRTEEEIHDIYDKIKLPTRVSKGAAGYDFKCPFTLPVEKYLPIVIPTGIKVYMDEGWLLKLYPKRELGFKYGMNLVNSVGIIDSDYYHTLDNEGHIIAKIEHSSCKYIMQINQGDDFMQGVFVEYGITEDDIWHY